MREGSGKRRDGWDDSSVSHHPRGHPGVVKEKSTESEKNVK
jgi:hypothetical protein